VYPCLHVHVYPPTVFLHSAVSIEQLCNWDLHSSTSKKKETNVLNYIVKCTWIKYFPWIYQMHKYIVSYPKFVHIVISYTFSRARYVLQKYIFTSLSQISNSLEKKEINCVIQKKKMRFKHVLWLYILIKHLKIYCFLYSQINQ
jgi:hypothetical protein